MSLLEKLGTTAEEVRDLAHRFDLRHSDACRAANRVKGTPEREAVGHGRFPFKCECDFFEEIKRALAIVRAEQAHDAAGTRPKATCVGCGATVAFDIDDLPEGNPVWVLDAPGWEFDEDDDAHCGRAECRDAKSKELGA